LSDIQFTVDQFIYFIHAIFSNFSSRSRLIRHLRKQQQQAHSQDEWMDLAERIDSVQGNDAWRSDPDCPLYERKRISSRIDEYVHLMRRHDIFELMFTLRGGIHRNKFGLLHEGLFSKAMAGSKVLVETYHNVVCAALDFVCDAPVIPGEAPIPTEARLAFFNETRHSYGRTALLLSGGAALGFYHVGVVKCLMKNGLMPRVIGGASAGSILCAMVGTRTDEECMNDLLEAKGTIAPGHTGKLILNFFRPLGSSDKAKGTDSGIVTVLQNSAGGFRDAKRTWQVLIPIGGK
jgi:TAG lipase / steryl ester hydrolase / phospholipase A2 / LPA acyltransferase